MIALLQIIAEAFGKNECENKYILIDENVDKSTLAWLLLTQVGVFYHKLLSYAHTCLYIPQPSVGEYDITQLHENTYYEVCVKAFTTQLSSSVEDRQHPAAGVYYEGSGTALADSQFYRQPGTGV